MINLKPHMLKHKQVLYFSHIYYIQSDKYLMRWPQFKPWENNPYVLQINRNLKKTKLLPCNLGYEQNANKMMWTF
jgi:hypothetical protein